MAYVWYQKLVLFSLMYTNTYFCLQTITIYLHSNCCNGTRICFVCACARACACACACARVGVRVGIELETGYHLFI